MRVDVSELMKDIDTQIKADENAVKNVGKSTLPSKRRPFTN